MLTIYAHDDCRHHVTPPGHPERVERLDAMDEALAAVPGLDMRQAPLCDDAAILLAHPESYLRRIEDSEPAEGWRSLDPDTHMSPGSVAAARRAVGANVAAVDLVMAEGGAAFCATRPPGHHAEKATAMGFCLFANASIAALHAIETHGAERVVIADFDVHHGNGTQDIFWSDPRVTFCSSHQYPLYPGTGAEHETGAGNIHNATLPPMSGGATFRAAWEDRLLPAIAAADPDLIVISAGFDAHERDPLAQLNLVDEDFAWVTRRLCGLAADHCGGRVVSTLEGGYDLSGLATAAAAHLKVLKEHAS